LLRIVDEPDVFAQEASQLGVVARVVIEEAYTA